MDFLKKIFKSKEQPIKSYNEFWRWFNENERTFFKVIEEGGDFEKVFFEKLSEKLGELKEGFYYLTGMLDESTVELILTPDGNLKNIVFVEELVSAAPAIPGWKFTALKPALDIKDVSIEMAGYVFKKDNIHFYSNDDDLYPDEIDITVVHDDLNKGNRHDVTTGTLIFLDNFLGELSFITTVDTINVVGRNETNKTLVPIEKLKSFLTWREKEFIEKYEDIKRNTDTDNYSMLEAELKSGNSLFAIVNTDLLVWDSKASHPWILTVEVKYDGRENKGMPDDKTYQLLDQIEDEITGSLPDYEGFVNIGRQTADNMREIYFACRDFRKPSIVMHQLIQRYMTKIEVDYDIYKDKYWRSFDRFIKKY